MAWRPGGRPGRASPAPTRSADCVAGLGRFRIRFDASTVRRAAQQEHPVECGDNNSLNFAPKDTAVRDALNSRVHFFVCVGGDGEWAADMIFRILLAKPGAARPPLAAVTLSLPSSTLVRASKMASVKVYVQSGLSTSIIRSASRESFTIKRPRSWNSGFF